MLDKDLFAGMIRLHVLHHACKRPVYGLGMIEELRRHGYEISAGTLYPMLHRLEAKQYLSSHTERSGSTSARFYVITPLGRRALGAARAKVKELFGELFEDDDAVDTVRRAAPRRRRTGH